MPPRIERGLLFNLCTFVAPLNWRRDFDLDIFCRRMTAPGLKGLTQCCVSVGLNTTRKVFRPGELLLNWTYAVYCFLNMVRGIEWREDSGLIVVLADMVEVEIFRVLSGLGCFVVDKLREATFGIAVGVPVEGLTVDFCF